MATPSHRVAFPNLAQIQLPVGAPTSILHRVSGVPLAIEKIRLALAAHALRSGTRTFLLQGAA
jgi:hypothetical protein